MDEGGAYWVFDDPTNTIFVFDSAGKFVRKVGRVGKGPGEFKFDGGMSALADGRVAVWDDGNARVSFFSLDGRYQTSWRVPPGSVRFRALGEDRAGQLYVKRTAFMESVGNQVPHGREVLLRLRANGVGDTLFAPDLHIPNVEYEMGSENGGDNTTAVFMTEAQYAPKMLWDWHPDGFFVTGHGALYQVTLFRTKERPIRIERTFAPVSVSAEERKTEELSILGDPSRAWRGPPLPATKPPLMDLFIARDGRIWARVPAPSTSAVTDNPDKRPGKPQKITTYRTPVLWEVFSREGAFLGRVAFPGRAKLMQADGNRVWAIQLDDDDLPSAVRYRIEPPLR